MLRTKLENCLEISTTTKKQKGSPFGEEKTVDGNVWEVSKNETQSFAETTHKNLYMLLGARQFVEPCKFSVQLQARIFLKPEVGNR